LTNHTLVDNNSEWSQNPLTVSYAATINKCQDRALNIDLLKGALSASYKDNLKYQRKEDDLNKKIYRRKCRIIKNSLYK
jgi:hypothetical protein